MANVDAMLAFALAGGAGLLCVALGALTWATVGRPLLARRQRVRLLEDALARAAREKDEHTAALASVSLAFTARVREEQAEVAAAVRAGEERVLADMAPVLAQLDALVQAAPPEHPLTPGLVLVARQLRGVLERRAAPAGEP